LAALGSVLGLRLGKRRLRRCQDGTRKLPDRAKHFQPVAERDAEVFEVLIGQVGKDRENMEAAQRGRAVWSSATA
jgi:hypothetical protein